MTKKIILFTFLALGFYIFQVRAQNFQLSGIVLDSTDQAPLVGVNILLSDRKDTVNQRITTTDRDGKFTFLPLPSGSYLLKASYIGYGKLAMQVDIDHGSKNLGYLWLGQTDELLNEIEIIGKAPTVTQKGDTLQFNASAYKTNPDANTEDLLRKMPGIVVENGNVKAQGEDVKNVLVDGKPFFGDDPTLAIRSLPAEVVDKVEVYDKASDQSQFTGFDDGNAQKTINIITRVDRRNGQFGKVYGGVGTDGKYSAGGNVNLFKGDQRISLIGLSNNINQQNFSMQDLLGVVGSSGRGAARWGRTRWWSGKRRERWRWPSGRWFWGWRRCKRLSGGPTEWYYQYQLFWYKLFRYLG